MVAHPNGPHPTASLIFHAIHSNSLEHNLLIRGIAQLPTELIACIAHATDNISGIWKSGVKHAANTMLQH